MKDICNVVFNLHHGIRVVFLILEILCSSSTIYPSKSNPKTKQKKNPKKPKKTKIKLSKSKPTCSKASEKLSLHLLPAVTAGHQTKPKTKPSHHRKNPLQPPCNHQYPLHCRPSQDLSRTRPRASPDTAGDEERDGCWVVAAKWVFFLWVSG
ncbi:hypothetical protein HanRHA438_Chr04g0199281 [Helianthus annuus]|nr:hypothetical protein HanIR_Chr04g0204221 [Helianthus annuus]KAJ0928920.1 hypothetical protein HanRHA438_Chr04g0199281 [Helianthus annuus]